MPNDVLLKDATPEQIATELGARFPAFILGAQLPEEKHIVAMAGKHQSIYHMLFSLKTDLTEHLVKEFKAQQVEQRVGAPWVNEVLAEES